MHPDTQNSAIGLCNALNLKGLNAEREAEYHRLIAAHGLG